VTPERPVAASSRSEPPDAIETLPEKLDQLPGGHPPRPPVGPPDAEWWTPEQAASWLQVAAKLIYRLAHEDSTFPAVKFGGAIRIRRTRLERWLDHPQRRLPPPGRGLRQPPLPGSEPHDQSGNGGTGA
jgi:excisionase family DNA binding protein